MRDPSRIKPRNTRTTHKGMKTGVARRIKPSRFTQFPFRVVRVVRVFRGKNEIAMSLFLGRLSSDLSHPGLVTARPVGYDAT